MLEFLKNLPPVKSGVSGIEWPPMPGAAASALLTLLGQFSESDRWPPELIRASQFRQLRQLVNHARTTAPFWRRRLDAAGYRAGAPMDDAVWANMAVIGRDELRAAGEAVHSTAPPSAHGTVTTATAGGGAFKFRRTQFSERVGFALAIRHHLWLDHDLSAKRAVIHRFGSGRAAYPEGRHGKGWDRAIETVFETGEVAALDDTTAIDNQLEWLAREQPRYLLTSPGNLERLARHAIGNGTRIAGLRATETTGGVPGPGLRALVREAWGVPVQDHYSTPETGCIALQCPETDHYHAAAEGALVEILDGDGRPCEPGETGRVVVTPLHNFATPLLRYDTGHRAESGAPDCRCGRTLPVLNRIEG